MSKITIEEVRDPKQIPSNTDIIIEIKNGEINIMSSTPPKRFLIINDDENSIILKDIKDPFMSISSVVKNRLEKWKRILKQE